MLSVWNTRVNWSLNTSELLIFAWIMLCCAILVKNFDLASIVAIRSRDTHYDKHNFSCWNLHLLPGMKPGTSSSPETYLAIMRMSWYSAGANIKISHAGHAGHVKVNWLHDRHAGMPNQTTKNWEWIIRSARDLGPEFS